MNLFSVYTVQFIVLICPQMLKSTLGTICRVILSWMLVTRTLTVAFVGSSTKCVKQPTRCIPLPPPPSLLLFLRLRLLFSPLLLLVFFFFLFLLFFFLFFFWGGCGGWEVILFPVSKIPQYTAAVFVKGKNHHAPYSLYPDESIVLAHMYPYWIQ